MCLQFDLPETLGVVAYLRKAARCMMAGLGVSPLDVDDLELIVGELATNAIRHAKGGSYQVAVECLPQQAVVTVIDKGAGFSPEAVLEPGTLRPDGFHAEERIGGFGLPLVFAVADHVDIKTGDHDGTTVRAEKRLRVQLAVAS